MFGWNKEKKEQAKQAKEERKDFQKRTVTGEHMAGLPLAQTAICIVTFEDDGVSFYSSGNTFNLSYDKVTAMDFKTSTEIQKTYTSSVGGAVAGAVLFGPLGAMVGGRAKEKKSKTVEDFIIFTYIKDGNVDYISFRVKDGLKAMRLINQHQSRIVKQTGVITL